MFSSPTHGVPTQARATGTANQSPKRGLFMAGLLASGLALSGCSWLGMGGTKTEDLGVVGSVRGFLGGASLAEPRAALVARDILSAGGTATDAAVAAALTLTVTLPSQAPLGGGGFCLVATGSARTRTVESISFPAIAARADSEIATPGIPRGLFALHARYGRLRWEQVVSPAESFARNGTEATRALAIDVAANAQRLAADPGLRAIFLPQGRPIAEGERMVQPQMAAALGVLRSRGPGDLHNGQYAREMVQSVNGAGIRLTAAELASGMAQIQPSIRVGESNDLFVGTTPASGALAAGQIFGALEQRWRATAPDARLPLLVSTAAAASRDRAQWLQADLSSSMPMGEAMNPARIRGLAGAGGEFASEPDTAAGTSFAIVDRDGGAVACALTGFTPFGIAKLPQGTGFPLAPAPRVGGPDTRWLTLAIALRERNDVTFVGAASGGAAAPLALARAALDTLQGREALAGSIEAPRANLPANGEAARVQAIHCPGGLIAEGRTCRIETDRRGAGLAIGSN